MCPLAATSAPSASATIARSPTERIGARDHGFVFEVPSPRLGPASAVPLEAMGLMDHEAAAVDPYTGDVT